MENDSAASPLVLSAAEARVLGCLMEKSVTTPDVYPLTFNSLITACNQKTNRDPVVDYDEAIVAEAIEGLRVQQLIYRADGAGSRVQKYRHRIEERFGLSAASQALLTVLLLRGPQTLGELRTRTERMHVFLDPAAVEQEIQATTEDLDETLWQRLPQGPGQKEARYMHCLYGEDFVVESGVSAAPAPAAVEAVQQRTERVAVLEARVDSLETELAELKAAFASFREQFE